MTTYYTTYGSVRGSCGHCHRTLAAAARCKREDESSCDRARGYSDRYIRAIDADSVKDARREIARPRPGRRLTEQEFDEYWEE